MDRPDPDRDPAPERDEPEADTERFRAFVRGGEAGDREGARSSFRVLTLLGGLALFALIVWLLLFG